MIRANYREFVRMFSATLSIRELVELYVERAKGGTQRIPKTMDAAFLESPADDKERCIAELIRAYDGAQAAKLQQERFTQRKRLANAEPGTGGQTDQNGGRRSTHRYRQDQAGQGEAG